MLRRKDMSMGDLCERWRLSRALGYELLKKWKEDGHIHRVSRSGRPKVITPRLGKILVNICDEKEGRLTFKELTDKLNEREGTSKLSIRIAKKRSGDEVATSTCRFLPTNTSQRKEWTERLPSAALSRVARNPGRRRDRICRHRSTRTKAD